MSTGHTRQGLKCKMCKINVHSGECQEKAAKCQVRVLFVCTRWKMKEREREKRNSHTFLAMKSLEVHVSQHLLANYNINLNMDKEFFYNQDSQSSGHHFDQHDLSFFL